MAMEVAVVSHQTSWARDFEDERSRVSSALNDPVAVFHHIGSTSIQGIVAKPIIDILIEVPDVRSLDQRKGAMKELGYECMGEFGIEGRRYFRKDSEKGIRTHHVHAFNRGSHHAMRHLAFRDFLISHPDRAKVYDELKKTLVKQHPDDMGAYIEGKDALIKELQAEAIAWKASQEKAGQNQSVHSTPYSCSAPSGRE